MRVQNPMKNLEECAKDEPGMAAPPEDPIAEVLTALRKELEAFRRRQSEIEEQYGARYVIVLDGSIVDADEDPVALRKRWADRTKSTGELGVFRFVGKPKDQRLSLPLAIRLRYGL